MVMERLIGVAAWTPLWRECEVGKSRLGGEIGNVYIFEGFQDVGREWRPGGGAFLKEPFRLVDFANFW